MYDPVDRRSAVRQPVGLSVNDVLRRKWSKHRDRESTGLHVDQRTYDAVGRVAATENALGYRTTYGYDSRGLPVQSQNAAGFLSTTSYDPLGRQIAEQNPLGQTTTSVFDAANRTVATENALGSLQH